MTDTIPTLTSSPPSVPQPLVPPPSPPPPSPGYAPALQPVYPPPVYVQAPPPPARWPQVAPVDPLLSSVVTEYQKRNYKIQVSGAFILIGSIGSYVAPAANTEPISVGALVAMLVIGVALPVGIAVVLFKPAHEAASKLKGAVVAWVAGWYPDPDCGPGALRYFDGSVWTQDRSPASQPI